MKERFFQKLFINNELLNLKNFSSYNDVELMNMFTSPKPICDRAFQEIYKRYSARLNSYCLFKIHNQIEAEEIFQQTWIKFYRAIENGKKLECVLPFLLSIARNLTIDFFRANRTKNNHIVDFSEPDMLEEIAETTAMSSIDANELGDIIRTAVNCLDEKYKEAFILKRYEELSLLEIAELLNITLSTAKQRVSRATAMVREILTPHIKDYIKIDD